MNLEELIEHSYIIFEKYTIGKTLDVCKRCCISDSDEAALVNTPLRQISMQQLRSGYFESARSNSDRELWEMKHFLPRVLELMANFEVPDASAETVFYRLNLANRDKWPSEELQLLSDYSVLFFEKCLAYFPYSPDDCDISTYLLMFSAAHFDLKPIIKIWEKVDTLESLLNFNEFILTGTEFNLENKLILKNTYADAENDKAIIDWLNDKNVKASFSKKIIRILQENKSLDKETFEELSFLNELLVV
ncbi:MAG TPA: hypothetical protein VK175_08045 [Leadbetterella sp.]|nr:hypothetical protein [Leadbetterella sp.]